MFVKLNVLAFTSLSKSTEQKSIEREKTLTKKQKNIVYSCAFTGILHVGCFDGHAMSL